MYTEGGASWKIGIIPENKRMDEEGKLQMFFSQFLES
jgi:hypothetical protein